HSHTTIALGLTPIAAPVTVPPQPYVLNALSRHTVTAYDTFFNRAGSSVTDPSSPFYAQAGVKPGDQSGGGPTCQSATPCSDNPDYLKALLRNNPRLLRVALKVTF